MSNNKMLIDAAHPEETRVVMLRGNRVDELDFESEHKKQLRGNIYLAKVTRVEPSLQAAFVDYGGNRHGFLAFNEIHPDYYQIPVADRQALLQAEAEAVRADSEDDEAEPESAEGISEDDDDSDAVQSKSRRRRSRRGSRKPAASEEGDADSVETTGDVDAEDDGDSEVSTEDADAHEDGTDDDEDGGDPKTMAAANETDVISEPIETPDEDAAEEKPKARRTSRPRKKKAEKAEESTGESADAESPDESSNEAVVAEPVDDAEQEEADSTESNEETTEKDKKPRRSRRRSKKTAKKDDSSEEINGSDDENGEAAVAVESVGAEDALEEVPSRRGNRRHYKIQEVIKRRQIILVQVVKEERGNKGAALTTYLSLAGRYSVLMPNTARGGGISRKITNVADRKRLKGIAGELEVADGMGVILRTAGASRTKAEIERDFEYLLRLWENVRTLTLQSTAPCLVYEEGSLIKRSIRDLYDKDTSEILVAGQAGYREAKDFMKMLMPSHAKNVKRYKDAVPLFTRMGVEAQLDSMMQPQVTLKSGGYLVINQTEALVAIDVNSGRATKQHSIEDTALHTNLEAADEIARQLRLRDLAGLIVIDFIDMEDRRNNRSVERRLKDALKHDRARIQVGRISHFGLMEMSRQRIRASVLESTTQACPTCDGVGHVRSPSSVTLHVLRAIEEQLMKSAKNNITVKTRAEIALYMLNHKRESLSDLETRFGVTITVEADETVGSNHLAIERGDVARPRNRPENHVQVDSIELDEIVEPDEEPSSEATGADDESGGDRPKRRRRRRKRGSGDEDPGQDEAEAAKDLDEAVKAAGEDDEETGEDRPKGRRRRGKRGGKKRNVSADQGDRQDGDDGADSVPQPDDSAQDADDQAAAEQAEAEPEEKGATRRTRRKKTSREASAPDADEVKPEAETEQKSGAKAEEPPRPKRRRTSRKAADADEPAIASASAETETVSEEAAQTKEDTPKKTGWWQKKFF